MYGTQWPALAGLRGGIKLEAYHRSRQPHSFPLFPPMFWDFGSLHQGVAASLKPSVAFCPIGAKCLLARCGVLLASCCGSGTQCLCRRCGVLGADCCGSGQLSNTDVAASQRVCCCGAGRGQSVDSLEELCRTASVVCGRRKLFFGLENFM